MFSSNIVNPSTDDLYFTRRATQADPWLPVQPITEINTGAYERGAHLDDYGVAMFYEYSATLEWRTRATIADPWSMTTARFRELDIIGVTESDPWLSPDLATIYFVRENGGVKDIWYAVR